MIKTTLTTLTAEEGKILFNPVTNKYTSAVQLPYGDLGEDWTEVDISEKQ